jgi:hypothetical protein
MSHFNSWALGRKSERVGPKMLQAVTDDEAITELSKLAYGLLPRKVRWVVGEKRFVRFCLANRDKLFRLNKSLAEIKDVSEANSSQIWAS